MPKTFLVGGNVTTVKAHHRSSPSDPLDKWGRVKTRKRHRRRRNKAYSGIRLGKY